MCPCMDCLKTLMVGSQGSQNYKSGLGLLNMLMYVIGLFLEAFPIFTNFHFYKISVQNQI